MDYNPRISQPTESPLPFHIHYDMAFEIGERKSHKISELEGN